MLGVDYKMRWAQEVASTGKLDKHFVKSHSTTQLKYNRIHCWTVDTSKKTDRGFPTNNSITAPDNTYYFLENENSSILVNYIENSLTKSSY